MKVIIGGISLIVAVDVYEEILLNLSVKKINMCFCSTAVRFFKVQREPRGANQSRDDLSLLCWNWIFT